MEMGMYELISHHQYGCQLKHNYIHYIEDDKALQTARGTRANQIYQTMKYYGIHHDDMT